MFLTYKNCKYIISYLIQIWDLTHIPVDLNIWSKGNKDNPNLQNLHHPDAVQLDLLIIHPHG